MKGALRFLVLPVNFALIMDHLQYVTRLCLEKVLTILELESQLPRNINSQISYDSNTFDRDGFSVRRGFLTLHPGFLRGGVFKQLNIGLIMLRNHAK